MTKYAVGWSGYWKEQKMNNEQKELMYSDVARYALKIAMLTNIYQFDENGKIDIALDEVLEKLADLMQAIREEMKGE